ncbi:ImmA/IrrE family metallo-endopeptidase [Clostridium gasigenes]|uniref:ImmA/IrrE family metallo-endopeptidase n=1 Tax=Clostridium gasigenes TaxID=94869 RepID=UPI00162472E3|nr:ImmA/IrrE family metallo-endopeptidase [Clostridium gasigenes]MBB6622540.1 ImmA/IrrE family metallo-endopeptidase [Clostridium gasigenes]
MTYDKLLEEYDAIVKVKEAPLKYGLKGLYKNGHVLIDSNIDTAAEKRCILAEELGHHYTTSGNILEQKLVQDIKQENTARQWAYEKIIGIVDLVNAYNANVTDKFEMAEYLNVTVEFLEETIKYYRIKYGVYYQINNYIIYFEPNFGVMKLF